VKLLYKPLGLLLGMLGGALATALFDRIWSAITGDDETPDATDRDSGWVKVVLAAVIQGAVFAGVRTAVNRAGAKGFEKATGVWPG